MDEFYYSLEDLPLDEWNGEDRDDSNLAKVTNETKVDLERERRALDSATVKSPKALKYVPFKREIKRGQIGPDSFAVKRALAKAGFGSWGKWGIKNLFGPFAVRHLKDFQKKHKLKVDGVYGLETHKKLAPYFDTYGVWLIHQVVLISPNEKKREIIQATAMVGYMHRYNIHYTQSSLRMQGVRNRIMPPRYPNYEDCSSFATWCYWVARASDPNGLNYDGQGYTGTLVNHGAHITLAAAKPGDLIFYGWEHGVPGHVAVYIGNNRVISHGGESGPLLLAATYRPIVAVRSYIGN